MNPTIIAVNNFASSIGLFSPKGSMKYVKVNGEFVGLYGVVEHLTQKDFGKFKNQYSK